MEPTRIREIVYGNFQRVPRLIRAMAKPVVAAVNGPAVGAGCEIAVACDFRIASERARFGEVWINIGCVPAMGGMFLLPRLVGLAKATELVMTGALIDAAEALRIGLAGRVVAAGELAAAKLALNRGLDSTLEAELAATLEQQIQCFGTPDFAEGVRALAEKRPPRFLGP